MRETHNLEPRYFDRMARSLGDKLKIVEQLPKPTNDWAPRVLDVGAGGGEFSHALMELGFDVVALDASDDAIMRMREKFPELTTARMLANEAVSLGIETFDAVVCSSILHEVFSYGDSAHGKGDLASLDAALSTFFSILKPGGVLVIRDGVKADEWDKPVRVKVIDGAGVKPVLQYLALCPFSNGWIDGPMGTVVKLRIPSLRHEWFEGSLQSAFEFFMTYTWGVESYPRETQELYGVLTLDEYSEKLTRLGYELISAESWLQEGYVKHLTSRIVLETSSGINEWPHTNALWVAKKP